MRLRRSGRADGCDRR